MMASRRRPLHPSVLHLDAASVNCTRLLEITRRALPPLSPSTRLRSAAPTGSAVNLKENDGNTPLYLFQRLRHGAIVQSACSWISSRTDEKGGRTQWWNRA